MAMTMKKTTAQSAILGALVADAAALGLHWLYDQERIQEISPVTPEFLTPNAANYVNTMGYFAHEGKVSGDISQYGEQVLVMLKSLALNGGRYDKTHYQTLFSEFFGYGGEYVGYIDHATRETLNNIARFKKESASGFLGADDKQHPAMAKLPALVVCYAGSPELHNVIVSAIKVTNNNSQAISFGCAAAKVIETAILTRDPEQSVWAAHGVSDKDVSRLLDDAMSRRSESCVDVTTHFGLACDLSFGVPTALHNIATSASYSEAIRQNILAGGDSCGRAILVGSVLGACYGIGGEKGIPPQWVERLTKIESVQALLAEIEVLNEA